MLRQLNHYWVYLIPLSIITCSIALGLSDLTSRHPELAVGITYDLTLLSPLLYLLAIRKKKIPKITAVPIFILGVVTAKLVLAEEDQTHLDAVTTYLLPLVELAVLLTVSVFVHRMNKAMKEDRSEGLDFYTLLTQACEKVLGENRVARIFATEIAMIGYALFIWKKVSPNERQFTQTKMSSTIALYAGVIMIILIEGVPVHLLLHSWSPVFAWVITILSAYSLLQIMGQLKSLSRRFHELEEDDLIIRNGVFSEIRVPYHQIAQFELSERDLDNYDFEIKKVGLLNKMENHNVILQFKEEVEVRKFYGIRSTVQSVAIWVDEKQKFETELREKLDLI